MEKLNILNKFFALGVVALFAINQAMITRTQQNLSEILPVLQIKNEVLKQGENAQVVVKLHDGKTLEGFISRISDDSFALTNCETQEETKLAYNKVEQITKIEDSPEAKLAVGLIVATETFGLLMEAISSVTKDEN